LVVATFSLEMSDDESLGPEYIVYKRHRKEKKELQAHIQALKKTASKGDKKKKKEVGDEIARMTEEMEIGHKRDLDELRASDPVAGVTEDLGTALDLGQDAAIVVGEVAEVATGNAVVRVSKAQKRRDAKARKDEDRREEIKRQEEENKFGARHVESDAIAVRLKAKQLTLHQVPSDGDCMYAAVAHQMKIIQGKQSSVSELRSSTAAELQSNCDEYLPFLSHPDTGDMLSPEQFAAYCSDVGKTSAWGGQVELGALSKVLRTCICCIQAEGPLMQIGEDFAGEPLTVTYHRHMYGLGEHYNSTKPMD